MKRRFHLVAAGTLLVTSACGAIVGVSDLTAPADKQVTNEAGPLPSATTGKADAAIDEIDSGKTVDPPDPDAGCDAQTAGPFFAHDVTLGDNAGQQLDWQNPEKALAEDNERSTAATVLPGDKGSIKIGLVDFSKSDKTLPSSAKTIVGIKVEVVGHANVPDVFHDGTVVLKRIDVGNILSANHAGDQLVAWPGLGDDVTHTFGGPTVKWELAENLTPDLIRNENFAIVYAVARSSGSGPQFYLNTAKMTVFYCE